MLQTLFRNYQLVRQVIPHPKWFANLSGIHVSVADNVLRETRKVSTRHILRISRAFAIPEALLQCRLLGELDPNEPGNRMRQQWLRRQLNLHGGVRQAALQYPGLGVKTMARLMKPDAIVSPIQCELVAQHTGWFLDPGLLHSPDRSADGRQAQDLLSWLRLAHHCESTVAPLPPRTRVLELAVPAELRYADRSFERLQAAIVRHELDARVSAHREWLKVTVMAGLKSGDFSFEQARRLDTSFRGQKPTPPAWVPPQAA